MAKGTEPSLAIRWTILSASFTRFPWVWNGKPLKPILDHKEGNNTDNYPNMLRLLCPNCESQLDTRGGRNKGRIEKSEGDLLKSPETESKITSARRSDPGIYTTYRPPRLFKKAQIASFRTSLRTPLQQIQGSFF
jgi:hypothetical protein